MEDMSIDTSFDKDDEWKELEAEIKTGCNRKKLLSICRGRTLPAQYRNFVWQHCLEVHGSNDPFDYFDGIYDLPEQSLIHADCDNFVDELANIEEERLSVKSDLESTLTLFCKSKKVKYCSDKGWSAILKPLIAAKLTRADTYNVFSAVVENFIARDYPDNKCQFHLFRLLLLYHDPEFCRFLDTKKISPDMFASRWFSTLFSMHCSIQVTLNIWDVYFQLSDPFLVQFLALVIVINARDQILCMESSEKEEISEKLSSFPKALEADDIDDFCSLAHYYISKTPKSFLELHRSCIYGSHPEECKKDLERTSRRLENALCLEVSVEEVIGSLNRPDSETSQAEPMTFFVVDCRPAYQFKVGHLVNSYHLNSHLMLQNPKEFNSKVQSLLAPPTRTEPDDTTSSTNNLLVNGGEHLCFLGEGSTLKPGDDDDEAGRGGDDDDDSYMNMVVAHFLQKHTQYVTVCKGGYKAIHDALKDSMLENHIIGHSSKTCDHCHPGLKKSTSGASQSQNSGFLVSETFIMEKFGKLSSAFKSTSAILKDKVITYIKNDQNPVETHVSSSDKVGRRYRNMASVFTIGDDDEEDSAHFLSSEEETKEMVNIDVWVKRFANPPSSVYECFEILPDSTRPSLLCLNENHLFVLRKVPEDPSRAWLQNRRSLCSILKITSKKRQPQFITIKYGAGGFASSIRRTENNKMEDMKNASHQKDEGTKSNGEATGSKPETDAQNESKVVSVDDRAAEGQNNVEQRDGQEGGVTVTAIDRFLIPRASEATKDIKTHIMRLVDMLES